MIYRGYLKKWIWLAVLLFFALHPLLAGNPDAESWAQKGATALTAGDYAAAVNCFQKAVESDPGEVSTRLKLESLSFLIQRSRHNSGLHSQIFISPGPGALNRSTPTKMQFANISRLLKSIKCIDRSQPA
jgi:tetratricopeptide (TPR) repeat protein